MLTINLKFVQEVIESINQDSHFYNYFYKDEFRKFKKSKNAVNFRNFLLRDVQSSRTNKKGGSKKKSVRRKKRVRKDFIDI